MSAPIVLLQHTPQGRARAFLRQSIGRLLHRAEHGTALELRVFAAEARAAADTLEAGHPAVTASPRPLAARMLRGFASAAEARAAAPVAATPALPTPASPTPATGARP